jgi:hypothetical protein
MTDRQRLEHLLEGLEERHRRALLWFAQHAGEAVLAVKKRFQDSSDCLNIPEFAFP